MVEEYEEIADSQYPSERLEYLDEDYGKLKIIVYNDLQDTYMNGICYGISNIDVIQPS